MVTSSSSPSPPPTTTITASCRTHYEVLNVAEDATLDQIKRAYHQSARRHHPDRQLSSAAPDDDRSSTAWSADFTAVQTAWECLRDPSTRQNYDQAVWARRRQQDARWRNAVRLHPRDCRLERVVWEEEETPHDDDDDDDEDEDDLDPQPEEPPRTLGASREGLVLLYACPCGTDLEVADLGPLPATGGPSSPPVDPPLPLSSSLSSSELVSCPGCSLVYDTSSLQQQEAAGDG